jgi:hypothetical protein
LLKESRPEPMTRFVKYQKRGVQLPPGCKDLIDVLKGKAKAKIPGAFTGEWEPVPKPDLFPSGGVAQIERYVVRILVSAAKFTALTVSSLDQQVVVGLYRHPDENAFDLMLLVLRRDKELEQSIRDFFGQRGIQHTLDYLCSGVKPNSKRGLKYPLPSDSKQVAVLLADLLTKVYGLDAEAGLAFAHHETAG